MLYADALKELFDSHPTIEAVTWSDHFKVRGGGHYTYDSLLKAVGEIEFAVFFVTADWKLENKKPAHAATPNVWYETGMFMSRYGKENVLIIEEENDSYNESIQYLTDLTGLQPQYYTLDSKTKKHFSTVKKVPNWDKLKAEFKTDISLALGSVKAKIEEAIFDDDERIFDTITSIKSREDCYKHGERIIQNASENLYSIVSYEKEYENNKYPNGLFPFIEKKLEELKTDSTFTPTKSKKMFKRWMNLANDKIAEQAKHILETHSEYIEIRDTFCNFIEVLISEQEVLLVLPKPENNEAVIGKGVLIKSKEIAREFRNWFNTLIPEPNSFKIDTVGKLNFYRETQWDLQNRRMEGDHHRCNACFGFISSMPDDFQKVFKANGLLK